jgi:sortase A
MLGRMRSKASVRISDGFLRFAQWACIAVGVLMCAGHAAALIAGELGRRGDIEAFEHTSPLESPPPATDFSLWSQTRVQQFVASTRLPISEPIAILRVTSLQLAVPLYAESTELHLNRGVTLIPGMSGPDEGGNVGIAGHRDGYFRVLKNIRRGDVVELQTRAHLHRYRIVATDVVDAADREMLGDTEEPTLTLVTCYPFYHVGHAPQRFIVRGEYVWSQSQSVTRR